MRIIKQILKSFPEEFFGLNYYNRKEIKAVNRIIRNKAPFRYYGNKITYETNRFEKNCCHYYNKKYAHAVNSGTGGLLCALHAFDVGLADEVIIPGFFWISVSNAILLRGAVPVFCEIDDSLNMDINDLQKKITHKTKCIIAIHMEGTQSKIDQIREICSVKKIKLLEDFSQANGGTLHGQKIGSFGDIAIASLQINKIITSGEGGILLTDDVELYNKIVARSDFGYNRVQNEINPDKSNVWITYGEGRRFNEIGSAIMNVQLKKLNAIVKRMHKNKYDILKALGNIKPVCLRTVIDREGDTGYSIIFIFRSLDHINAFMRLYETLYKENEIRFYRLIDKDYRFHIYYDCDNLVTKKEVLPDGFPWKYFDSEKYTYAKGLLPYTDDILARSLAVRIPANLNGLHKGVLCYCIGKLIDRFKIMFPEHLV